jgi:hypothetical protein
MLNKYHLYDKSDGRAIESLLQNDKFILARIKPEKESDEHWKEQVKNKSLLPDDYRFACNFINTVQTQPEILPDDEIFNLWENIEIANKQNLKIKKARLYIINIAAAAIALLIVLWSTVIYPDAGKNMRQAYLSIENVEAPERTSDVQLLLSGDQILSLDGDDVKINCSGEDIDINDGRIILKNKNIQGKHPKFHQLIVPYGKRSSLTLNEGSKIWANAGTRVVFPPTFEQNSREIYVDGEVYVEVARNDRQPFVVKTKKFNVEALGTQFNVMAYEKDSARNIILVSGSVKVHDDHNRMGTILKPHEMYTFGNGAPYIETVQVESYISWKSGAYLYESEPLERIAERLSHYYGEIIECTPQAAIMQFSGKLDLKNNLERVLDGMIKTAPITYRYQNGIYRISNK